MNKSEFKIKIGEYNRITVPIIIRDINNEPYTAMFKCDTGADFSTISSRDLLKLGYTEELLNSRLRPSGSGSTADGMTSEWFSVDLNVNHFLGQVIPKGLKFPFLCLTKKNINPPDYCDVGCELAGDVISTFRASLLGNDILSCFDIVIDRSTNTVEFIRAKDLSQRNKMYADKQVSELIRDSSSPSGMNLFGSKK